MNCAPHITYAIQSNHWPAWSKRVGITYWYLHLIFCVLWPANWPHSGEDIGDTVGEAFAVIKGEFRWMSGTFNNRTYCTSHYHDKGRGMSTVSEKYVSQVLKFWMDAGLEEHCVPCMRNYSIDDLKWLYIYIARRHHSVDSILCNYFNINTFSCWLSPCPFFLFNNRQ